MTKSLYIVAYLNLFDGELVQEPFYATDALDALNRKLDTNFLTEEEVYQYAANCDSYISAYKV